MFLITPMVKNLLILNFGIHIILFFLGGVGETLKWELLSARNILSDDYFVFQHITYMWLHGDFWHLFWNMFALFIFGPALESAWGYKKFLTFYLAVGIGAGLIYTGVEAYQGYDVKNKTEAYNANPNPDDFSIFVVNNQLSTYSVTFRGQPYSLGELSDKFYDEPNNTEIQILTSSALSELYSAIVGASRMVGASGAILGIVLAFGLMFPDRELFLLFIPFPIKAFYLAFFYGAFQIYQAFMNPVGDNTSYVTHLGGIVMAFIVLKYWQKKHGSFY